MGQRIGFADIETTGLDWSDGHRIVECAAMLYDLDTRKFLGKFEQRINPQRPVEAGAAEVHGITYEMVADKPLWEEIGPKFRTVLSACDYWVAHNGDGFDWPFILSELQRIGEPTPALRTVDTMTQARWATADGSVPTLGKLAFACDVPYDKALAHAALYDVDVMAQCFFKTFDSGFFKLPTDLFMPKPREGKKK